MRTSRKISLVYGLVLVALSGCAGTKKIPTNPDTEPPPPEEVLGVSAQESEAMPVAEAAPEPTEEEAAPRSATAEDFQSALQAVLMDDALLTELKLEEPGRFPLKIAGPDVPGSTAVQAHAKNVEVITTPSEPDKVPVLIFTEIDLDGEEATFKYQYPIEGVRGTTKVTRGAAGWEVEKSRISQYR